MTLIEADLRRLARDWLVRARLHIHRAPCISGLFNGKMDALKLIDQQLSALGGND